MQAVAVSTALAVLGSGCARRAADMTPVPEPDALAERLRAASVPDQPRLIQFEWRYAGRDGRFSGDGAVRVNPPDSVRLDLLGPGWSGVQSAVLLGDEVRYVGEQRVELPPPTFLWAMFGVFRPPPGRSPYAARAGGRLVLRYDLTRDASVVFEFDDDGGMLEAELKVDGHTVQRIKVERQERRSSAIDWAWPKTARYRDLGEYHEVSVEVTRSSPHAPFERAIFQVAAR